MGTYIRFFLGTPKRLMWTVITIGIVVCTVNPEILKTALENLSNAVLCAVGPLLGPAIAVVIVFAGLRLTIKK